MHLDRKTKKYPKISKFLDWLIYILGYTIVFIIVTNMFKSVYIDLEHSYIYSVIIVLMIYFLNKTIKPMLVTLTIPITGLTLGLFYPFINLFILKLVDWILGPHFQLHGLFISLFIALLLSITNLMVENIIIKPIIKRVKKNG